MAKNPRGAFNQGTDDQPFLPGVPGIYFLYVVFCLPDESAWHHHNQSEFLGLRSVCSQCVYGSIVGLVFGPGGRKVRQAYGQAQFRVVGDRGFRRAVMVG